VGGEVTTTAGIPSDVLAALRGALAGGVRGPEQPGMPTTERLAFQPPQSSPLDGMLRLVLLTQPPADQQGGNRTDQPTTDNSPRTPTTSQVPQPESAPRQGHDANLSIAVQRYLQRLNQLWKATVNDLFGKGMPKWQPEEGGLPKAEPPEQPDAGAVPEANPPESDDSEDGMSPAHSTSLTPGWAWLGVGLGLAIPGLTDPRKRPDDPGGAASHQEQRAAA
jgi:hypothetical protein